MTNYDVAFQCLLLFHLTKHVSFCIAQSSSSFSLLSTELLAQTDIGHPLQLYKGTKNVQCSIQKSTLPGVPKADSGQSVKFLVVPPSATPKLFYDQTGQLVNDKTTGDLA